MSATTTNEDFVTLLQDELGLQIGVEDLGLSLDTVPGWDSVYLLRLLVALEKTYGRRIAVADLLEARSLGQILQMVVAV